MALDADVIVVGLGAMGSATLWRLTRRPGMRVLGIEQFEPGHDRGASHGQSRVIRTAYAEGVDYVPLLRQAWQLWPELSAELLIHTGCLTIGPPDADILTRSMASARAHGLAYELLGSDDLSRRYPQHQVGAGLAGGYEAAAGLLFPERAVRAAVAAARAGGAEVRTGLTVEEVRPDPDRPRVVVAGRELTARHVVVAGGAWLPRLVPRLAEHLAPERRVQCWFPARDPAEFTPDRFPVFLRTDRDDRRVWYGCPTVDGRSVKVAMHADPDADEPVDPLVGPRPPDQADAKRVEAIVADTFAGLVPRVERMAACTYTMTPDQHFVVGQRRDLPGLTLLGGFSGHGFKFAPVLGEAAAQLAVHGRTDVPIGLFDPHRFD